LALLCVTIKINKGAYTLDDRGSKVRFQAGAGNISLLHHAQTGSRAHPTLYSVGTGGFSPGIKRPGREADNSTPSGAEVNNAWSYTSTPSVRLHSVVPS